MADRLDRVGQRMGDYRLLRWLGGGGFGNVYLAEQIQDHSRVALKLLHTRLSSNEELKAFINEARTIRLQHAHIVPLLDFGMSQEDLPYLVLEYVSGGTLRDRHPKGSQVPLPLVLNYAQQVSSALQYAHEQGIIHRDVKPRNMILRGDGTVQLSDFGLMAVIHSSDSVSPHQGAIGTVAYVAPEQIQGQAQAQSDQYSLGVVVYEWITGQRPFQGTTVEVAMQHAVKPPPSLVTQMPGLAREVEAVVLKALAKDPKQRFVSVSDFTSALAQAIQEAPTGAGGDDASLLSSEESLFPSSQKTLLVSSARPDSASSPRIDWGEAPTLSFFYGREQEQAQLSQWVVQECYRVVSVLGMGGIGKSTLVVNLMHGLATETEREPAATCPFEIIIFRSLRDAPSCDTLLDECLQVLSPQSLGLYLSVSQGAARDRISTEQRLSLLLEHLRQSRVLLVLDNLECLLQEGNVKGHFRPGFEEYGQLLRRVAETSHQSCLLFTSREKPTELRLLESKYSSVRTLRLAGLDVAACKQLLEEKGMVGTEEEQARLISAYGGNPLALKVVAETIVNLFSGEIGPFLVGGTVIFSSITDLLDEQFARLSPLEKSVLYWLAIVREPVTFDELQALFVVPLSSVQLLEAVDASYRHSLIESGKRPGSFLLQSVVLEYVTGVLIAEASDEIQQHRLNKLIQYSLSQAHAKEYVRQTQERLLLSQLLAELERAYRSRDKLEAQLLSLLDGLRALEDSAQGYGPANLIALLRLQRGNLNGLDLSYLYIRGVYLQGIEMRDTKMVGAQIHDCIWTSAVSSTTWTVAMSLDGKWWACGDNQGQVRIWKGVHSPTLHLVWRAHSDLVYAFAFSPDGRLLASGGQDGTVKLWDVERGALLWTGSQYFPRCLAFSPDGRLLVSGGSDATVQFWDPQTGTNLHTLTHPSHVWAVAWSPDGSLLSSGCRNGEIRLWERQQGTTLAFVPLSSMQTTNWVARLAFAPDGRTLASTSWRGDQTVKLWEVGSYGAGPRGQLLHTLEGYADNSRCVAWSPDGQTLAYSNPDKGICVFDVEAGRCRAVLHGHCADVHGLGFTPDGTRLLSGSADGTLRVWDVENYRCVRVTVGYGVRLLDLDWSPDGTHLVSGDTDGQVTLWDTSGVTPPGVLYSHTWVVEGVGWSPDGKYLSSCGLDGVLCVWDPTSHTLVHKFENPKIILLGMAWSSDGSELAYGTYGQGIQVWNAATHSLRFVGHSTGLWSVAWSPNGTQLVGGDDDGGVYIWKSRESTRQAQDTALLSLLGHQGRVMGLAWSPDGKWVASGSGNRSGGELFVWDILTGERVQTFEDHPCMVSTLAWDCSHGACPHGDQLISGGTDGMLRWWDVESGKCFDTKKAHHGIIRGIKVSPDGTQLASCGEDGAIMLWDLTSHEHLRTLRRDRPYERLGITGIRGLNEAEIASLQALGAIEEMGL